MNMKTKNPLIIVMALFVIALLILVYKVNTLVLDRIPKRTPTEVYIIGMTEAIDRQNQCCTDLSHAIKWLERHLGNCITLLESERGFEPIPIKDFQVFSGYPPDGNDLEFLQPFPEPPGPFVVPYEKPKRLSEKSSEENSLELLRVKIDMSALGVAMAKYSVELRINNFQERLQRLDTKDSKVDPNGL